MSIGYGMPHPWIVVYCDEAGRERSVDSAPTFEEARALASRRNRLLAAAGVPKRPPFGIYFASGRSGHIPSDLVDEETRAKRSRTRRSGFGKKAVHA